MPFSIKDTVYITTASFIPIYFSFQTKLVSSSCNFDYTEIIISYVTVTPMYVPVIIPTNFNYA